MNLITTQKSKSAEMIGSGKEKCESMMIEILHPEGIRLGGVLYVRMSSRTNPHHLLSKKKTSKEFV